jgi:hypothetical protein
MASVEKIIIINSVLGGEKVGNHSLRWSLDLGV